jgi:hypothetical protein
MTRSFRLTTCRGDKKAHPGLDVCESEKQELRLARSLCDSGSIKGTVRLILKRVEEKGAAPFEHVVAPVRGYNKEVLNRERRAFAAPFVMLMGGVFLFAASRANRRAHGRALFSRITSKLASYSCWPSRPCCSFLNNASARRCAGSESVLSVGTPLLRRKPHKGSHPGLIDYRAQHVMPAMRSRDE